MSRGFQFIAGPNRIAATIRAAAIALALVVPIPAGAQEEAIELTFRPNAVPGSTPALSAAQLVERLKGSVESLTVSLEGTGQPPLPEQRLLRQLKLGRVDLAVVSSGLTAVAPPFAVFDVPYLIEDRAHLVRVEEKLIWPLLAPLIENQGFTLLAVWEKGFAHFATIKRPVLAPVSLIGLRVGHRSQRARRLILDSFDAIPIALPRTRHAGPLKELYDGVETTLPDFLARHGNGNTPFEFVSLTGHRYEPAFLIMARRSFDRLPTEVGEALKRTARGMQPFVFRVGAEADRQHREKLAATDLKIFQVERQQFLRLKERATRALIRVDPDLAPLIAEIEALAPGETQ